MAKFQKELRTRRTALDLTMRGAARAGKFNHSYWLRLESGEQDPNRISWQSIKQIAKALRVKPAEVIDWLPRNPFPKREGLNRVAA